MKNNSSENKRYSWQVIGLVIIILIIIYPKKGNNTSTPSTSDKTTPTAIPTVIELEPTRVISTQEKATNTELIKGQTYIFEAMLLGDRFTPLLSDRQELLENFSNWTDGDMDDFNLAGLEIQDIYEEAKLLTPNDFYSSFHKKWIASLNYFSQSAKLTEKGFKQSSATIINQANEMQKKGIYYMDAATEELKRLDKITNSN